MRNVRLTSSANALKTRSYIVFESQPSHHPTIKHTSTSTITGNRVIFLPDHDRSPHLTLRQLSITCCLTDQYIAFTLPSPLTYPQNTHQARLNAILCIDIHGIVPGQALLIHHASQHRSSC